MENDLIERIKVLENKVAKLEQIEKRRRTFMIIKIVVSIILFIGIAIAIYFFVKYYINYLRNIDNFINLGF